MAFVERMRIERGGHVDITKSEVKCSNW
jgi:hypothetical protein